MIDEPSLGEPTEDDPRESMAAIFRAMERVLGEFCDGLDNVHEKLKQERDELVRRTR